MVLNKSMISKGIIISCLQFIKVLSFFLFYKVLFAKGNSELVSNFVLIETYVNLLASICSFGIIDTTVRLFKDFKGNITLFLKNHLIIFLITYFVSSIVLFLSINELENRLPLRGCLVRCDMPNNRSRWPRIESIKNKEI